MSGIDLKPGSTRRESDAAPSSTLDEAIDGALRELWIAFQPVVRASTGAVEAYEAYLRSRHPGLPTPVALLDAAERRGRILEVGDRVRALVAAALPGAPAHAHCLVNVEPGELTSEHLLSPRAPLAPHARRCVLQITARAPLRDPRALRPYLDRLRGLGYRIARSVTWAAAVRAEAPWDRLPADMVKLDISIVRNVESDPARNAVVRALVAGCLERQITVVAEGVETQAQRDALVALGCDLLQEYVIARPSAGFARVRD